MVQRTHEWLRVAIGAAFCVCGCFLLIALWGRYAHDPSYTCDVAGESIVVRNWMGMAGAWIADFLLYTFGGMAYFFSVLLVFLGLYVWQVATMGSRCVGLLLTIASMATFAAHYGGDIVHGYAPGGRFGIGIAHCFFTVFDPVIAWAMLLGMLYGGLLLCIRMAVPVMVGTWCMAGVQWVYGYVSVWLQRRKQSSEMSEGVDDARDRWGDGDDRLAGAGDGGDEIFSDPFWQQRITPAQAFEEANNGIFAKPMHDATAMHDTALEIQSAAFAQEKCVFSVQKREKNNEATQEHEAVSALARYGLPLQAIFQKTMQQNRVVNEDIEQKKQVLESALRGFGIRGSVTGVAQGPVVTLFEYTPASDMKLSKIVALEDDLARLLRAMSLRIIAPIPGTELVGFEVSNTVRMPVFFSDLVHAYTEQKTKKRLPLMLGYSTTGAPFVSDMTDMPHLLIAGTTGSGKSVGLTALITGMLCSCSPDQLKLILIDPKRLEFLPFADIPHLIFPIITDTGHVKAALSWVLRTMSERYTVLSTAQVRTIGEYHEKFGVESLPFIMVIIDELADIMMTVGKEVEPLIARIAQMARAAGIHMIIATQRPSVDVVTGLIKANFPSRIAFKVATKIDSKTIVDGPGAERLLGKGDMLFFASNGDMQRLHGAYVRPEEVSVVASAARNYRVPEYCELDLSEVSEDGEGGCSMEDPLYEAVRTFVGQSDEISISLLQRQFRIGFNRSARLVDQLRHDGIVAAGTSGKMRKVVK